MNAKNYAKLHSVKLSCLLFVDLSQPIMDMDTAGVTTADVTTADVTTADVTTADVTTADVSTADVTTTDVTTADVTTADVTTADVTTADVTTADVTTADVTTADVTTADVTTTDVTTADVSTADVTTVDVTTADVPTADVTTTDVTTADVTTADVTTANVTTADVTTADVTTTDVTTADVTTADVSTADVTSNNDADNSTDKADMVNGTTDIITQSDDMALLTPDKTGAAPEQTFSVGMNDIAVAKTVNRTDAKAGIATTTIRRMFDDNCHSIFFVILRKHLHSGRFCDLSFVIDGSVVRCHKLVISASSLYWREIFDKSDNEQSVYPIRRISKIAFNKLLAWFYRCDVTIKETCIAELILAAIAWQVEDLLQACAELISETMNIDNVCWFYHLSVESLMTKAAEKCSYFIREHYELLHNTKQLEKLTGEELWKIVSNDEINVTNENVIFDSIFRLLQPQPDIKLLTQCYRKIRFNQITPTYLNNQVMRFTSDVPQRRAALDVGMKRTDAPSRFWDHLLYISIFYDLCKYDVIKGRWTEVREVPNSNVDHCTTIATFGNRMVMVGAESSTDVTLTKAAQLVRKMPKLPTQMALCGVTITEKYIFIVGGQTDINSAPCLYSVYRVSICHRKLETLKPMHHGVASPLVLIHREILYVIGGTHNDDEVYSRRVVVLDLMQASGDWKHCEHLPKGCDNTTSGVVMHEGKITVLTTDYCMTYDDVADSWSVEQYECQGDQLKPVVYKDDIWALVKKNGKHCVKYYYKKQKEWKIKIRDVPDVLYTNSFMIERRYVYDKL